MRYNELVEIIPKTKKEYEACSDIYADVGGHNVA